MTDAELREKYVEECGIPEPQEEDYESVEAYWAAHNVWLNGFAGWCDRRLKEEAAARIAEEEAARQAAEEEAARQAEEEEPLDQQGREEEESQAVQETDRYPVGSYVDEFPTDGKVYDPGSVGSYVDAAGNLWSASGELMSPGTTPAMEPEEAVMEAAGDVVTGEPAIDTALLLLDLYNAITGEDGMTGDIDGIQEVMDHPLMTTSFQDYTVTEGLLLLLLLSAFIAACARILKGGFSWLR